MKRVQFSEQFTEKSKRVNSISLSVQADATGDRFRNKVKEITHRPAVVVLIKV